MKTAEPQTHPDTQADGAELKDTPVSRLNNALQILYGADHESGNSHDVLISRAAFDDAVRLLNEARGGFYVLYETAKQHPLPDRFLIEQLRGAL